MTQQYRDAIEGLDLLAQEINTEVHDKGFYAGERTFGDVIALIHSEISEAFEEYRNGRGRDEVYFVVKADWEFDGIDDTYYSLKAGEEITPELYRLIVATSPDAVANLKPEGIPIELADTIIRCLDELHAAGVSAGEAVQIKMAYNQTRPYKHGKVNL